MVAETAIAFSAHWRALETSWARVTVDFSDAGGSCWAREMERLFIKTVVWQFIGLESVIACRKRGAAR